jgi:diadenosine tetraphosphatase ApaH/serine/threonine PP2A family protein phosphatase/Ca2+-binding EF-hand superfamily protein
LALSSATAVVAATVAFGWIFDNENKSRMSSNRGDWWNSYYLSLQDRVKQNTALCEVTAAAHPHHPLAGHASPTTPFDPSALFRVKAALEARTEAQKVRLAQIVHDLQEMAKKQSGDPHQQRAAGGPNRLRRCVTMVMSGLSHRTTREVRDEHPHFDPEGHISLRGINLLGLTTEHAMEIVDLLRGGARLDKRSLLSLIAAAKIVLRCDPTLIDLRGRSKKVTVVGDLHGSMACLNNVLQLAPYGAHVDRTIVFDGDFVDRGEESVEVLATLLLLKLADPEHVVLLRGNHEDELIASVYGFQDEVRLKYGVNTAHDLWEALGSLFAMFPIAARTETSLILHGGIPSESFDLERLLQLTPQERSKIRTVVQPETDEEAFLADILWSDPSEDHMGVIENPRGHGKSFGINVARNFLDRHNIKYLIRGHEPVERGLDELRVGHGHYVLTVFSNASYPNGEGTNLGAVVHLDGKDEYRHDTFSYSDACTKIKQTSQTITDETIATLRSMIASRRIKLQTAFRGLENKDGRVSSSDWVQVMSTELDLPGMPWRLLLGTLAPATDADDQIDWRGFLERNSLPWTDAKGLDERQIEKLHDQHEMLLTVFKFLDVDGKGKGNVGLREFKTGVDLLNRRLPRGEQLRNPEAVFRALDRENKGYIKVEEFGTLFRVA